METSGRCFCIVKVYLLLIILPSSVRCLGVAWVICCERIRRWKFSWYSDVSVIDPTAVLLYMGFCSVGMLLLRILRVWLFSQQPCSGASTARPGTQHRHIRTAAVHFRGIHSGLLHCKTAKFDGRWRFVSLQCCGTVIVCSVITIQLKNGCAQDSL